MHIVITDSGVGGLSVCAYAERFVRTHGFREPVQLTFANAAPANDYGYNAMPTKQEKLETFDRFLRNVTERFAPDMIYVACNTLSVLLPETSYFLHAAIPVRGIVETGVELLASELEVCDGRFTGRAVLPLCYGRGKIERAERFAAEHGIDLARSYFYSDSISDLPMLERVGEPRVVCPDPRLRREARRRRWPILE